MQAEQLPGRAKEAIIEISDDDEDIVVFHGRIDKVEGCHMAASSDHAISQREICLNTVRAVFPDICRGYVSTLYDTRRYNAQAMTVHILDNMESGTQYPKTKNALKLRKRNQQRGRNYNQTMSKNLPQELDSTPMGLVDIPIFELKCPLFPADKIFGEAELGWRPAAPPYDEAERATLDEQNVRIAEAEGTMIECGCCFNDYPLNRLIHCNSDAKLHWFCCRCARQAAETEIGNSRYELRCISMDGCEFGFSKDQKDQYLDETMIVGLDRNEKEAVLRMAGLEDLASCPFCPFAAVYPSVEEYRLFHCQAPDCEKISCRLCKLKSHVPKTCEENATDNILGVRQQIEEAMSAALIRKCNKCKTPFVKEEGCNKMTCTRQGCCNIQCYVCSKSCTYSHFDDCRRGGKVGNCPLFESVEQRHKMEVRNAEIKATAKVRAEYPEYADVDLKIKFSEKNPKVLGDIR